MITQSLPFRNLIKIDRNLSVPVFKQVADGIITLIRAQKLRKGFQLPPSREMASVLGLNRSTVVMAYDDICVQGWVEVIRRKGIFVSSQLPDSTPVKFDESLEVAEGYPVKNNFYRKVTDLDPRPIDSRTHELFINDGYPDQRIAPLESIYEKYRTLMNRSYLHSGLLKDDYSGSLSLREEIALFVSKTRGLNIGRQHVMVTRGAQLAITIAAKMVLKPGSTVVVGNPNYVLADRLFEQLGAKLIKINVDQDGMDVDALEEMCARSRPDLLYIIPHHHHPTTVTLSAERRVKLMGIIKKYQLPVIEDDYDYDFHYNHSPILPLASGDHGGYVLYVGSISKTLAPTVRMGYLIGAEDFIWQASKLKQILEIRGDVLFEESIAHIFSTGEMQRHLRRSLKLYKNRRDEFCELLNQAANDIVEFKKPEGGMAVWAEFDKTYPLGRLSARLLESGIYLNEGSTQRYGANLNAMRIGFASLNSQEMNFFIKILKLKK